MTITIDSCEYKPLSDHQDCTEAQLAKKQHHQCFTAAKNYSTLVGIILGVLMQSATLGVNWLILALSELHQKDEDNHAETVRDAIIFGWSGFTAMMGVAVLLMFRALIVTVFKAIAIDGFGLEEREAFFVALLDSIDLFFSIGAVSGVAVAWCIADCYFGFHDAARESLVVAIVALVWYWIASAHFYRKYKQTKNKTKPEEPKIALDV